MAEKCNLVDHKVGLNYNRLIKQPVRLILFHLRSDINKIITKIRNQGVIKESSSFWCSPVVIKQKKDSTSRLCVDF